MKRPTSLRSLCQAIAYLPRKRRRQLLRCGPLWAGFFQPFLRVNLRTVRYSDASEPTNDGRACASTYVDLFEHFTQLRRVPWTALCKSRKGLPAPRFQLQTARCLKSYKLSGRPRTPSWTLRGHFRHQSAHFQCSARDHRLHTLRGLVSCTTSVAAGELEGIHKKAIPPTAFQTRMLASSALVGFFVQVDQRFILSQSLASGGQLA